MITIYLNEPSFEYDVYNLTQAFYPHETIEVSDSGFPRVGRITISVVLRGTQLTIGYAHPQPDGQLAVLDTRTIAVPEETERKEVKNMLKRLLYQVLSQQTGRELPWGTLTGIRPTKIFRNLLESGMTVDQVAKEVNRTYLTGINKIMLATEIAQRELAVLDTFDYRKGYSLYVGIPFCPTTCLYCSFTSYPISHWAKVVPSYLAALKRELAATAELMQGRPLQTIYIGGGTPTTLTPEQLDGLLDFIKSTFDLSDLQEGTIEAGRPDSISRAKLEVLTKYPFINRISINPQTMKDETLRIIGRSHTTDQILTAYDWTREAGIPDVNMDLIIGLPGESEEDVMNTIEQVGRLQPENVTVHSLAIKRAARLNLQWNNYSRLSMDNTTELTDRVRERLGQLGLTPYYLYRQKNISGNQENIGYARPGKEGIYNILIMEELHPILACGAGSASKYPFADGRKTERTEDVKEVEQYITRIDEMIQRKKDKLEELKWL